MSLEMRELKASDIFPILKLLGKLNLKEEILAIVESNNMANVDNENAAIAQGMAMFAGLAQKVLDNIDVVEDDINSLLANLTGKDVKEIGDLSLKSYAELIFDFFDKPELTDFFEYIVARFKKEEIEPHTN